MQARPTSYMGTMMRSRLEARYARWLDQHDMQWQYEPLCFADRGGEYLPDFRIDCVLVDGQWAHVYVEVKPEPYLADLGLLRQVISQMTIIRESDPDAVLLVDTHPDAKRRVWGGDYYGWIWAPLITWINIQGPWSSSGAAQWLAGWGREVMLERIV